MKAAGCSNPECVDKAEHTYPPALDQLLLLQTSFNRPTEAAWACTPAGIIQHLRLALFSALYSRLRAKHGSC